MPGGWLWILKTRSALEDTERLECLLLIIWDGQEHEHLVAYSLAGGVRLFSRLQVRRGFHLTPLGREIFVRIGAEDRLN